MENIDAQYITNRFCNFYTNCISIKGKQQNYVITGIRSETELEKIKSKLLKSELNFKYFKKAKNKETGKFYLYFFYTPILYHSLRKNDENFIDFNKNIL